MTALASGAFLVGLLVVVGNAVLDACEAAAARDHALRGGER